jgi:hypothetical protein
MVMVKHKLAPCDRYVVKERGQHRDRCQSIECAYSLLAKDGTQLGCGWVATSQNTWITRARSGSCDRIFQLLKKYHDYGIERIVEKDAAIAELKESIANARLG